MPKKQYLQKALEYIDQNILEDISLYDISNVAGFSVPHFYRLFKNLTGDTIGAYISRRRLSLAAKELIYSDKSISSIAYEYGFDSHDVFTRAFTRMYGISPKQYRKEAKSIGSDGNNCSDMSNKNNCNDKSNYNNSHEKGRPPLKRLEVINEDSAIVDMHMKFSMIHTDEIRVIGLECQAVKWDSDGSIGRVWSDFLQRVEAVNELAIPTMMYGICEHETCGPKGFTYMAAVGVNESAHIPAGMMERRIKATTFFCASVPDDISIPDAYAGAAGVAQSLGYELAEYDEIEVYQEIFRDPDDHIFNLWVPVEE